MGILISKTYALATPESIECGDYSETGFEWEDVDYDFRELVELIDSEPFIYASSSEICDRTWLSSESWCTDYTTGEDKMVSLHFSHKNPPSKAKYWIKAINAARFVTN